MVSVLIDLIGWLVFEVLAEQLDWFRRRVLREGEPVRRGRGSRRRSR